MSRLPDDLTAQRFGMLTALTLSPNRGRRGHAIWICRCDCGRQHIAAASNLKRGNVSSCGCLGWALFIKRVTKHGGSYSPEFNIWHGMKQRCLNLNDKSYKYYGGRGILVCDRWRDSFEHFLADMGPKLAPNYSIDRIDNDGNYEPSNCRWATSSEQNRNKRRRAA